MQVEHYDCCIKPLFTHHQLPMRTAILIFIGFITFSQALAFQSTFKGYTCTQDCSGHIAGYEWAKRKGITDPSQCGGKSRSFYEGCVAYAEGK